MLHNELELNIFHSEIVGKFPTVLNVLCRRYIFPYTYLCVKFLKILDRYFGDLEVPASWVQLLGGGPGAFG